MSRFCLEQSLYANMEVGKKVVEMGTEYVKEVLGLISEYCADSADRAALESHHQCRTTP